MAKAKFRKLHKNICVAYARLIRSDDILCRQISGTEEAAERGAGYIYFGGRGGAGFPSGFSAIPDRKRLGRARRGWPVRRIVADLPTRSPRGVRRLQGEL